MSSDIPESDWRRFKEVHTELLERYCRRILEEIAAAGRKGNGTAHERYLEIYKIIEERDRDLARVFNDFRRSTAAIQLGLMRRMNLLTDEELSRFSEPTRTRIEAIASL